MVHYSREKGIDDGAIHMAFLTDAMPDIKTIVFPTEASCGSILDVHNSILLEFFYGILLELYILLCQC